MPHLCVLFYTLSTYPWRATAPYWKTAAQRIWVHHHLNNSWSYTWSIHPEERRVKCGGADMATWVRTTLKLTPCLTPQGIRAHTGSWGATATHLCLQPSSGFYPWQQSQSHRTTRWWSLDSHVAPPALKKPEFQEPIVNWENHHKCEISHKCENSQAPGGTNAKHQSTL